MIKQKQSLLACSDKVHNCADYGHEACIDELYRPWTTKNCPLFCGLCVPPSKNMATTRHTYVFSQIRTWLQLSKLFCPSK